MPPEVFEIMPPWGVGSKELSLLGSLCARDGGKSAAASMDQSGADDDLEGEEAHGGGTSLNGSR